jgi:hypothetical protein|tara:strand:+ start:1012 stop:1236 length:225 start_codon:yes stop_codon:yes gene_type:complete
LNQTVELDKAQYRFNVIDGGYVGYSDESVRFHLVIQFLLQRVPNCGKHRVRRYYRWYSNRSGASERQKNRRRYP